MAGAQLSNMELDEAETQVRTAIENYMQEVHQTL
jgi:hypothetical protein